MSKKCTYKIGFLPDFVSLGETIPLLKIARLFKEKNYEIVLFSHGGQYQNHADELDTRLVALSDFTKVYQEIRIEMLKEKKKMEEFNRCLYSVENIQNFVEEEINAFKKEHIDVLLRSYNLQSSISSRFLKIPLISLVSGSFIPPYFKANNATFPDCYENRFTRLLPQHIKDRLTNWYLLNTSYMTKNFNQVSKSYGCQRFDCFLDLYVGDYNLVCDDMNLLNVKPDTQFHAEDYIGPIYGSLTQKESSQLDAELLNHVKQGKKSVLVNIGFGADDDIVTKILSVLKKKEYTVVVILPYFSKCFPKEEEQLKTQDNVLYRPFIDAILELHKLVDISIIHGGRGTTYTALQAAKPIIGIPMVFEQQNNIENVVRFGAALRISKNFFCAKELETAVDTIFSNYGYYRSNAEKLAQLLLCRSNEKAAFGRIKSILCTAKEGES